MATYINYQHNYQVQLSDAVWRAFGSAISDTFLAGGYTKVYSSIDWTNATAPASNTTAGAEIWESGDATGGLNPFYIRITYGTGTATTPNACHNLWIALGWAHNGTGSLSGITTTQIQFSAGASNHGGLVGLAMFSAGNGYATSHMYSSLHSWAIERMRDHSTGNLIDEVAIHGGYWNGSGGWLSNQVLKRGEMSAYPQIQASTCYRYPNGTANNPYSAKYGVGLTFAQSAHLYKPMWTLLGVYAISSGSTTSYIGQNGNIVPVNIYGATHSYMLQASQGFGYCWGQGTNTAGLILCE